MRIWSKSLDLRNSGRHHTTSHLQKFLENPPGKIKSPGINSKSSLLTMANSNSTEVRVCDHECNFFC